MRRILSKIYVDRSGKNTISSAILLLFLLIPVPTIAAELSIEYEVIARSGTTPIPGGSGTFADFGVKPAVDADGNVAFVGASASGTGVYTATGICCQRVMDPQTLIPGGGGATFVGASAVDIENGRVALLALDASYKTGLYSNVGQINPGNLVEVTVIDGNQWSVGGEPWVDGDSVYMYGRRLIPSTHYTILQWDGSSGVTDFVDPGAGYEVGYEAQASASSGAAIFNRVSASAFQVGISYGSSFETLATANVTPMPGGGGEIFTAFFAASVVDRGGQDAAFLGYGTARQGLYKRVDGGALQKVADNTTATPGAAGDVLASIAEGGITVANRQVAFYASGRYFLRGIYTDIGGDLSVLLDNETNNELVIDGQIERVDRFNLGSRSFAYTPDGYVVVFSVVFESGETAIIKATINDGPPTSVDQFTVNKDFSDNNSANVNVSLSCTSGTVSSPTLQAREGAPAVFTVTGAQAGATCTATEPSVPSGYSRNQSGCQSRPLNSSCTIINTLNTSSGSFTVNKDFSDNNTASVSITASCSSGTVTNSPQTAREGAPAVFTVTGAQAGTTCTATEPSVPSGYSRNQADCQNGDPLNGSCTIVNTVLSGSTDNFWVYKDFSDNNSAGVNVYVNCSSGTVTNNPQLAREGAPARFIVVGAAPGAKCTATENPVPNGYTADIKRCQNGDALNSACTIINNLNQGSTDFFTVYKDFSDNNSVSVGITASCSSGTVTNNPQTAREGAPAVFTVSGAQAGATCTATEPSVPSGYSRNQADCQNGDPLNGSCTIINTLNQTSSHTFRVHKDFSDNNPASVSITLTCTSGTVTNNPQLASEGSEALFSISGATAGSTCRAVENPIPAGYSRNQADCQNGDPLNGNCTIINTKNANPQEVEILHSTFENALSDGWTVNAGGSVESGVAVGQYALKLVNDGATSRRSISTGDYTGVSISMSLAAQSLQKNDSCSAEYSTNGGNTWSTVRTIGDGSDNGTFHSGTVSSASVSNNPNLVLRFRVAGKGKGDYCYGDEIIVTGTQSGSSPSAYKAETSGPQLTLTEADETDSGLAASTMIGYTNGGFDPGFDNLIGDGNVSRQSLNYEMLMSGDSLDGSVMRSAFAVPAGAATPEHRFEGQLELLGEGLPGFSFAFTQLGNHLYPVTRGVAAGTVAEMDYVIDTGRVWRETGDNGFSRASIPFMLMQSGGGCVQEGVLSFLFSDDGATSNAVYQLAGGSCGAPAASRLNWIKAAYSPGPVDTQPLGIQSVLDCAADAWLPLVQGQGGISLMLMPGGRLQYALTDANHMLWLDAARESGLISALCK